MTKYTTSLIEPLVERSRVAPGDTALIFVHEDGTREKIPVGRLDAEARRWAAALSAAGVAGDDVIVLVMGHSLDLVFCFLGAQYLGAVPSILAYPTPKMDGDVYAQRVRKVVAGSQARAVVVQSSLAPRMRPLLEGLACPLLATDDLGLGGQDDLALPPPSAGRIAFLQYTSGTTATPKGIPHTHERVLAYIQEFKAGADCHGRFPDDVIVNWLPLYHDLGLVSGLLAPIVLGIPSVLISPIHWVRRPGILLRAIHEYRGTLCWVPNFALHHCARGVLDTELKDLDLSSLRALVLGGEPVREESMAVFTKRFASCGLRPHVYMAGYGMAELVEAATVTAPNRPLTVDRIDPEALHGEQRAVPVSADSPNSTSLVSVGRPMAGADVAIVDAEGRSLPERRVGEIHVRSPYMFTGYHGRPDLTARALHDGWFRSGDLGYLADGELFVCGRKSDLIIVGGRNLYPDDLEWIAGQVPGIHAGRVVAFGLADQKTGTERVVVACEVDARLDEEGRAGVVSGLKSRAARALDIVVSEVRLVERGWIIKTSNGKMARGANRQRYLAEFAAAQA